MAETLQQILKQMKERHKELSAEIASRERELEAVIARKTAELGQQRAELVRLDAVMESLGDRPGSDRAPRQTRSAHQQRSPRRTRARRGENVAKIRALLDERPGSSASEVAAATRIAPRVVSTALSKMKREGAVEGVDLSGGKLGYRLAREA